MNINEKNIQTNTSSRETGATLYDAITNKLTVRQFLSTAGNESRHSSKRDECSFVFYRLPGESEYIFISQCGDTSEIKSWDIPAETQGVIIAPYEQSGEMETEERGLQDGEFDVRQEITEFSCR